MHFSGSSVGALNRVIPGAGNVQMAVGRAIKRGDTIPQDPASQEYERFIKRMMQEGSEMNTKTAAAFFDELEKIARVSRAVKQYRRALMLRAKDAPRHSTGLGGARGAASDGLLRGGPGAFGEGTYWSVGKEPTRYGPVNIAKGGDSSMIERIKDPKASGDWGIHRTSKGTSIGKGDVMTISKEAPMRSRRQATYGPASRGPARVSQHDLVSAARKRGMKVVEPEAEMAAAFRAAGGGKPMVGNAKRDLIKATRKRRKVVEKYK
jgi:hypothetical protein